MSSPGNCHACDATLEPENTVRLWDGRDYCRSCVEAACPGLSDYAASHETLEETEEWTPAANIWWNFKISVVVLLLGGIFVTALVVSEPEIGITISGALIFFSIVWLLGEFLFIVGELWLGKGLRETIRVHGGQVTITAPHRRKPLEYSLARCRWHVGKGFSKGLGVAPSGPRLVLKFPTGFLGLRAFGHYSTFGSTPEMLGIWRGFLALAGIEPLRPPWWLR